MHLQTYNELQHALSNGDHANALSLATNLQRSLRDSLMSYGWHGFPETGVADLDAALKALNKHLGPIDGC